MWQRKDPSSEDVALRAHELYLQRGSKDGHDVEDWLRAERELRYPLPRPAKMMAARVGRSSLN